MDPFAAAKSYVEDKLSVEFVPDKSELLDKIVRAFFEKVPFQNISTGVLPAEERFPTELVVFENATNLKGGLNVHNNWFFKMMLEALGYKVEYLPARIEDPPAMTPRPFGSHFAILVKDLNQPGDLHLVDVGSGHPVFKPVPLNNLPYQATDVTLTYRFVEEDGQWHSEHKDSEGDHWTRVVSYDKESVTGSPADLFRGPVLDFLREDWLVGGITAVHWPQPRSSAIPDIPDFDKDFDYSVWFNNDEIRFRNGSGFFWREQIPEDITVRTLQEYFPNIPKTDVEQKIKIMYGESALLKY